MKFFPGIATEQKGNKIDWPRLWRAYDAHLAGIRGELSPEWRALAALDLHDARLVRVERPKKKEVVVHLDSVQLAFRGVSHVRIPRQIRDGFWVYS